MEHSLHEFFYGREAAPVPAAPAAEPVEPAGPFWLEGLKEFALAFMFLRETEVSVLYDEATGMQQHTAHATINNTATGATKHRRTK
jgi:hypothetical protein